MIHVFHRNKYFPLSRWDTTKVPNNAYILDAKNRWFWKFMDRLQRVPVERIPKKHRTMLLLIRS